jgi:hypothetical protein
METAGITKTADIAVIANSNPQIKMRRGLSSVMLMQRSGAITTTGHDLEECKTFLDHKKMSAPQEP